MNMKQLLTIFLTLIISCVILHCINSGVSPAYAEGEDLWENFNTDISSSKDNRFVSDEEFEQAIKNKNKKVDKWKNILLNNGGKPKGTERYQSNETEIINNNQGEGASLPVISIPAEIKIGDGILPVGHYQIEGKNNDGKIVLNFYQAHNLVARIPAKETSEDYEQEEILFASWLPEKENSIKIIYGSLDFNAYAVVDLITSQED